VAAYAVLVLPSKKIFGEIFLSIIILAGASGCVSGQLTIYIDYCQMNIPMDRQIYHAAPKIRNIKITNAILSA
jgi:hypothetical protein